MATVIRNSSDTVVSIRQDNISNSNSSSMISSVPTVSNRSHYDRNYLIYRESRKYKFYDDMNPSKLKPE